MGKNVLGKNVFWGKMSYGEKCHGEICHGEKWRGENCHLGKNVTEPLFCTNPIHIHCVLQKMYCDVRKLHDYLPCIKLIRNG